MTGERDANGKAPHPKRVLAEAWKGIEAMAVRTATVAQALN
ncbi:hypothetical protein [Caballeronia sp. LZ001]|nr:hypothetical protein [Caballeronia sp. LZ001]MDR5804239.1 hypothetical protein [Caballeronia sp. LZ001]